MADPPPDWQLTRGHWEDRYDVHTVTCAACAAKDRKAHKVQQSRETGQPPPPGQYMAVQLGDEVT